MIEQGIGSSKFPLHVIRVEGFGDID